MFCPKCGSLMDENATRCVICGEEVESQGNSSANTDSAYDDFSGAEAGTIPTPVKRKPKKSLPGWLMPAAIACVALVAALVVFFVIVSNPKTTVKSALGGFDDAILDNELLDPLFNSLEEFHAFVDVQQITSPEGQKLLTEGVRFDIYSDSEQASCFVDLMGTQFDVHYLLDPMTMVFNSEAGAYGIVFEGLKDALSDSIFNPDSDSKYALDMNEEEWEMLESYLEELEGSLTESNIEELNDYLSDYGELIIDLMWEYGEIETESDGGNRIVSITLDEKSTAKIAKDFIKTLCSDKELIEYLDENVSLSSLSSFAPSWLESWEDVMDLLQESSGEMINEIKSGDFKLVISVTASSIAHNLKGVDVKITVDNVSMKAGIAFEDNDIILTASMPGAKFTAALEETEDGWTVYAKVGSQKLFEAEYTETDEGWKFEAEAEGAKLLAVEFATDDDAYVFEVEVYDYSDEPEVVFTVEGQYTEENGGFTLTIEEVSLSEDGDSEAIKTDVTIGYYTDFDMPDVPEYSNLLEATEEELDELLASLEELYMNAFGGMMGEALPEATPIDPDGYEY